MKIFFGVFLCVLIASCHGRDIRNPCAGPVINTCTLGGSDCPAGSECVTFSHCGTFCLDTVGKRQICPAIGCGNYCATGYVLAANGCPTCTCL